MNGKPFYLFCLVAAALFFPPELRAQNLILDGGFDQPLRELAFCTTAFPDGVWMAATGEYGWDIQEERGNRLLLINGASVKHDIRSGKRALQYVACSNISKGFYTLKFKAQIKTTVNTLAYVMVAQQKSDTRAPILVHIAEQVELDPKAYATLVDQSFIDMGSAAGGDGWKEVKIPIKVPEDGRSLVVIFEARGATGSVNVDDVALFAGATPPSPTAPVVRSTPPPAPVENSKPAPKPTPKPAQKPTPPPAEPLQPPVGNLILGGDFSGTALAVPAAEGSTTDELSGHWLSSTHSPWQIAPSGGNLGPCIRAATSREVGRLLYVAKDTKRSKGNYFLRFDYILGSSDALGVKVFVSDRDITIGVDAGTFRLNNTTRLSGLVDLPASASWVTYYLPVELGEGYNYVYVLFAGKGNTGLDNVSLSPRRD